MIDPPSIRDRLEQQKARIRRAATAAGRDPDTVRLLAVSKTHPVEAIVAAYDAGQRDFGENYVQELTAKAERLSHLEDLRFHLIGHLQSNKAKHVAALVHGPAENDAREGKRGARVASVQTVSTTKLARELAKRVGQRGAVDVLVEVNVAGEASKSGCSPEDLSEVLDAVEAERSLRLCGLMTVPPFDDDPERTRPHFEALFELATRHGGRQRLPELSMGMSHDAEVAVSCGATWVRIGTAIFGPRPPQN